VKLGNYDSHVVQVFTAHSPRLYSLQILCIHAVGSGNFSHHSVDQTHGQSFVLLFLGTLASFFRFFLA
jgi:hypothetical protein